MSDGRVNAPDEKYIDSVHREQRVSKSGNNYQVLVVVFANGYKMEQFLSNEQQYILSFIPLVSQN